VHVSAVTRSGLGTLNEGQKVSFDVEDDNRGKGRKRSISSKAEFQNNGMNRESKMLVLRSSTTSPFARKIRIAISILGLEDEIRIENADTLDPKDSVRQQTRSAKFRRSCSTTAARYSIRA